MDFWMDHRSANHLDVQNGNGSIDCKLLGSIFGKELGKCGGAILSKELGAPEDASDGS